MFPLTISEKETIALPNGISCLPNSSISFSPVKKLTTPPLLGIVDAISDIALPALAAATTDSSSTLPLTVLENLEIALPNGISCLPNSSISFSPAKNPTTPPLLGIVLAISAISFPALAAAITASSSTLPFIIEENLTIAFPNGINCSENSANDFPPIPKEAILSRRLAAVRTSITSAKDFTPCSISGSIIFAPIINGVNFIINADKSSAILGKPDVIPDINPPTIFPKNAPRA